MVEDRVLSYYLALIGSHNYMQRRLAQQRITLSDLEWPFHASCAISAIAELLVKHQLRCIRLTAACRFILPST